MMTYKEFVLIYTTLILGLSCANIFYGLGHIMTDWQRIKVNWTFFLSPGILIMTIVDFWFHAFWFSYDLAETSILVFIIFLLPPIALFFGTLITFPSEVSKFSDYTTFFERILRPLVFTYGIMILFTLVQLYISQFMLNVLLVPLSIYFLCTAIIYITNSLKIYKILAGVSIVINISRWVVEGLYY